MSRQDRAYALRRPAGEHRRSCPGRAAGMLRAAARPVWS